MKKHFRDRHTLLLRFCSLGILLLLMAIALAPSPASAVPHKESSGPLLGDPDGPDQSPSPGPAKAATVLDRSSSISKSFTLADTVDRRASRAVWLRMRAIEFFTVFRLTLGKQRGN
jgi:hypothetical protein